jgi:hypothetical protein
MLHPAFFRTIFTSVSPNKWQKALSILTDLLGRLTPILLILRSAFFRTISLAIAVS